jgi:hypothetical protein
MSGQGTDQGRGEIGAIDRIFTAARSVRTPIQLVSFSIGAVVFVVLLRATFGADVLAFTLLLLPFILLIVVFNDKTLAVISRGGYAVLTIAILIVIGSFIPSAYIGLSLVT